jgi:hypothetical protein
MGAITLLRPLRLITLFTIGIVFLVGCTAPRPIAPATPGDSRAAPPARSTRTMTMVVRTAVTDLAPKLPGRASPVVTERLFNAALTLIDGHEAARPYLVFGAKRWP